MVATVMTEPDDAGLAMFIRSHGDIVRLSPGLATTTVLATADPYRTFRSYKGQKHYSGSYWSVTDGCHVGYESRLELARALLADFTPDVRRVIAQPFLLRTRIGGMVRRHVPDYLLFTGSGLTVVEVKPACRLSDPKVVDTFAWVRDIVEDAGWEFEIFSEPDPVLLANIRFFSGYRRTESVSSPLLNELRSRNLTGLTFAEAVRRVDGPPPCVRAALLHILWRQEVRIDLSRPLCSSTLLSPGAGS
jgi:hypothetical protein